MQEPSVTKMDDPFLTGRRRHSCSDACCERGNLTVPLICTLIVVCVVAPLLVVLVLSVTMDIMASNATADAAIGNATAPLQKTNLRGTLANILS